jgi:hypothetical protein
VVAAGADVEGVATGADADDVAAGAEVAACDIVGGFPSENSESSLATYIHYFLHLYPDQDCQIFLGPNIPKLEKYTKRTTNYTKRL